MSSAATSGKTIEPVGANGGVGPGGPLGQAALDQARAGADALGLESDLHLLLGRTLEQLSEATACRRVVAWTRAEDGALSAQTLGSDASALEPPTAGGFADALALGHTTDLGDPSLPGSLTELARARGLWAAAPVTTDEARTAAVILIGGSSQRAGAVQPHTLAALDAVAKQVARPLATAAAAERLCRLDQDVRRLDRLASLGGLTAEIIHEIRNPMVSVKTFLQLLAEGDTEAALDQDFQEVAMDELRRVERLLDAVLDHAQPSRAAPSEGTTQIRPALESVVQLVRHRAAHRCIGLETEIPDTLPEVTLSGDALRQVLLNLALNALDATPEGGQVTLRARVGDGEVALAVEDEGPGVPEELRRRLFEPFFSTKNSRPGGLGLAITRSLVEECGGRLEVADRKGGGAVFLIGLRVR